MKYRWDSGLFSEDEETINGDVIDWRYDSLDCNVDDEKKRAHKSQGKKRFEVCWNDDFENDVVGRDDQVKFWTGDFDYTDSDLRALFWNLYLDSCARTIKNSSIIERRTGM